MARKRQPGSINASSMADIAFLLLIFFLVTTTIDLEKGILQMLPPINTDVPSAALPKRNSWQILVAKNGGLMINGEPAEMDDLRTLAKAFVDNHGIDANLSDNPKRAVISLKYDVSSSYKQYIAVQNELKAAYRELRDAYALKQYGYSFGTLQKVNADAATDVVNHYPMRLIEPEPHMNPSNY